MRKRLLAGLLALCMVFGLVPNLAFAAEEPASPEEGACICKTLCTEMPNVSCTVCTENPLACTGTAATLDDCTGMSDCTAAVHQDNCLSQAIAPVPCIADANCRAMQHSETCPLNPENQLGLFAVENKIYVSQENMGTGDGSSTENAMAFRTAMEGTDITDGLKYVVVGEVSVADFTTPEAEIHITGENETSVLHIQKSASISGGLVLENLQLKFGVSSDSYGTLVRFFANGNDLVFGEDIEVTYVNGGYAGMTASLEIFGGSENDIACDTSVAVYSPLMGNATLYGGGFNADVQGDTHVLLSGKGYVGAVFGGGYAYEKNASASIDGDTYVTLTDGASVSANSSSGNGAVYGGGEVYAFADGGRADVTGTTHVYLQSADLRSTYVYGGSDVSKNGWSTIQETSVIIESTNTSNNQVYAGSRINNGNQGSAVVNKASIVISRPISGSTASNIYGGGYGAKSFVGEVSINLDGGTVGFTGSSLYAGGNNSDSASVNAVLVGSATVTLRHARLSHLYAAGNKSAVEEGTTIVLNGAGPQDDPNGYYPFQIHNSSVMNRSVNPTNTMVKVVTDPGTTNKSVVSRIKDIDQILIENGAILEQHIAKKNGTDYCLFDKYDDSTQCEDVVIGKNGQLILKSTNEIAGDFYAEGNLKNSYASTLIVGGTVTSGESASYTSSLFALTYAGKFPFLAAREDTPAPVAGFLSTDDAYLVGTRGPESPDFQTKGAEREWYLTKLFVLKPLALTKYITGDGYQEGEDVANCFPEPRFENLSSDAVITVKGEIWNCAEHDGQYPFSVNYYEVLDGTEIQIVDDYKAGDYLAKVEPLLGYQLSDITINGCGIKPADSTLHIRQVSNVSVVEDIETVSNTVVTEIPDGPVEEAIAVVPEDTTFLVNDLDDQLPNEGADIRLLYDEILPAAGSGANRTVLLKSRLETLYPALAEQENRRYEMKYLDLIDAADSNLWISSTKGGVVYLPYPAGTDESTRFELYHFMGLHRDNDQYIDNESVEAAIANCEVEKVDATNTPAGIRFEVGRNGFSPFALTWVNAYTVTFLDTDGSSFESISPQTVEEGEMAKQPVPPVREGYTLVGWFIRDSSGNDIDAWNFANPVLQDIVLYAKWEQDACMVTFLSGMHGIFEHASDPYQVKVGIKAGNSLLESQIPDVNADGGYVFVGWRDDSGTFYSSDALLRLPISGEMTFTAQYVGEDTPPIVEPDPTPTPDTEDKPDIDSGKEVPEILNGDHHFAYIIGYPDGGAHPLEPISRAEVASIFFRLLRDEVRDTNLRDINSFTDVAEDAWYHCPVSTMEGLGILHGRSDGTFAPTAPITRAEFAAICARFDDSLPERTVTFSDITGHWAEAEIEHAAALGWIHGYPDGSFRPDQSITRAEAMSMINRMLLRQPKDVDDLLEGMNIWYDNLDTSKWYYLDVQEATNSHDFVYYDGVYERWICLTEDPDWLRYNEV